MRSPITIKIKLIFVFDYINKKALKRYEDISSTKTFYYNTWSKININSILFLIKDKSPDS